MKNPPFTPGEVVRVRRAPWRIADVRVYEHCALLTLSGLGSGNAGLILRIVAPFDTVQRLGRRRRPQPVRPVLWRRACRALLATQAPPGALGRARQARIDLLPYQLEPALALIQGRGSRVLLADEVGLGKTIQAGLIIAELRARGVGDRVLVLTPPGLRDQWVHELQERFGTNATVVDPTTLRRLTVALPRGVDPWATMPTAVTSIDYVKRPEVLPDVIACAWDVVVIDEAHAASGGSDRYSAVSALASRAAYVVLVTATPHNGDGDAFASLCAVGSIEGDRLLVFRRTRHDVSVDLPDHVARHVHRLHVRLSPDEARMHDRLGRFARVVRKECGEGALLALSVLHKRAFSSAHSLERSIERRLDTLSRSGGDHEEQLALPMGDPSGEITAEDDLPAWPETIALRDVRLERRLLRSAGEAAKAAAHHETKIAALRRLLRRIGEPAIVFTEYRDTLLHLQRQLNVGLGRSVIVLHGGMAREERVVSLERFIGGDRAILLATDAAGQGLNLHHACRVVINLELPWNPMRLEQRIGRVDRLGQRRTVHTFHLVASRTGEALIIERLRARIARARAAIDVSDPLGGDVERAAARLVVDGLDTGGVAETSSTGIGDLMRVEGDLKPAAHEEAERLRRARTLSLREVDEDSIARLISRGPLMTTAGRKRTRSLLRSNAILFWSASCEDGAGLHVASTLVPISIKLSPGFPADRTGLVDLLEQVDTTCRALVARATDAWRMEVGRLHRAFIETRLSRERARAELSKVDAVDLVQVGLFDWRAVRAREAADCNRDEAARIAGSAGPIWILERRLEMSASAPQVLLLLMPWKP